MPDEKKLDPFKPVQPSIPGVAAGAAKSAPAQPPPSHAPAPQRESSSQPLVWVAVAAVAVFIIGGALLFWLRGMSPRASEPIGAPAATTPSSAAAETPRPSEKLLVGPGPVATTEELTKTWAAKRFLFPDPVTSERVPAMVVHLPDGSYWAFSLREPFGSCELEFVSDTDKLSSDYNYRADHPMVGNPCTRTVYDLLRFGSSSNGGLVRGEIVQGTGIRPPMAIEVRVNGKQIEAVRME
jgi:hypothetical protein